MVQLNVCSGFCRSLSFFDLESHKIAVIGKCCRMVDSKWVNVTLNCDDGERVIKLPSATECRCFDCASDE
uniref:Cys_knot domain-containing protein n=1 Tax=Syphacia muris TaxID=451379 RepID=A0A0N5AZE2_9BILA